MNKRDDLKQNELAHWLDEKIEDIRPYLPAIGLGTLAAVVVVAGIWWYSSQQAQASAASWNQYFSAIGERNQEEALQKVVADEKTSEPANWARQTLADMDLARGAAAVFIDREESKKRLENAAALYAEVLKYTKDPLLQSRAGFGLARVQESLFKPEEAKKLYEEVAKAHPDTVIGDAAADAAKRLSRPEELNLLAWLAEQKPKRAVPSQGGLPGGIPGLPSDLPDRPDIGLPGSEFGLPSSGGLSPDNDKSSGGLSFPAPGDAPASEAPVGDAPAGDDSKTDAPAVEKSTEETPPPDEAAAETPAPAPAEEDAAAPAEESSK